MRRTTTFSFRFRLLGSTAFWGAAAIGAAVALQAVPSLAACNVQPNPPGGALTTQSNVTVICDLNESALQGNGNNDNVVFTVGAGASFNSLDPLGALYIRNNNTITVNGTINSAGPTVYLSSTGNRVTVNSGGLITSTFGRPVNIIGQAGISGNIITVNSGGAIQGGSIYLRNNDPLTSIYDNTIIINQGGTAEQVFLNGVARNNVITVNGSVACAGCDALNFSSEVTGNTITVGGSLTTSNGNGIGMGDASNNAITINAGGLVSGTTHGMLLSSANGNSLIINGTLRGTGAGSNGILIYGNVLNNTITIGPGGVVSGVAAGIGFGLTSDTRSGNTVTNSGTVSGATAISFTGGAIGDTNTIVNEATGVITATGTNAIVTGGSALNLTNKGTINGNLLFDVGDDTLTLFTGQTLNGTVAFGAGNDRLVLDGTGTATFAGTMTGQESLTKQGSGTWTLGTSQTFNGGTTVNAGTLLLGTGTTLTSNATVNNGGTLGGSGTLGGNLTLNGGRVSPGASIGTLTIAGNANLSNGTTLIEVGANATDRLIVGGAATLAGGTVQFSFLEAPQTGTYTFLNAGSIVGQFGTQIGSGLFVAASLSYTGTTVSLDVNRTAFGQLGGQSVPFENQQATAAAFDRALLAGAVTGDAATVFAAFNTLPSTSAAANAFGQLGGEIHTSLQTTGIENAQQFAGAIRQHLRRDPARGGGTASTASLASISGFYANNELIGNQLAMANAGERIEPIQVALGDIDPELGRARGTAWMRGFGLLGSADGEASRATNDLGYRIAGIAGGLDYALTRAFTLGVALGYANTETDLLGTNADYARTDSISGALYGMWNQGPWFADASLGYAYDDYKTERRIIFGGLDRKADSKYHGREIFVDAEAGYRFRWGGFRFEPSLGLAYTNSHQSSFDETGANSVNLSADSRSIDSIRASIGARVAYGIRVDDGMTIVPEARLRYQRELGDEQRTLDARFAGINGGTFTTRGAEPGRDAALIGLGVTANLDPGLAVFVDYDADIRSNADAHAVTGGLRLTW